MATVTPNFNWPVPTSTDLVKDGATAIEALGDSIDASLVDLKGGTTGQVLSKTSNTDMDFTWVAQDDSNAIQNTIVDAKGDLIAASAADTPARLAVGSDGETLVADSSTSTGLRWQVPVNDNPVLNASMQLAQRGTTFTSATGSTYTLDRWQAFRGSGAAYNVSQQATNDTTNLPFIQYCARVGRPSGNTATTTTYIGQNIESINSIPYAGKTVTFSFYLRAGANFSAASNLMSAAVVTGTGTDQNIYNGFTGGADTVLTTFAATTTWQRFTATATIPTATKQLGIYFAYVPTGTAGAADYFEVTGVQVEVGSVATPFKTYAGTIQGELAACQRYYVRFSNSAQAYASVVPTGYTDLSTSSTNYAVLPVEMRIPPTAVEYSSIQILDGQNGSFVPSAVSVNSAMTTNKTVVLGSTISGATAGRPSTIRGNNSTSAYVAFSAEL